MRYLLDVNVLLAWGWQDHADHERTAAWIAKEKSKRGNLLLTSAIPQLGFVRVSAQRSGGHVSVTEASRTLAGMLASLGARHAFVADNIDSAVFPVWWNNAASRTTDAHLLQLAKSSDALMATLDHGIPGAFLIPLRTKQ